MTTTRNCRGKIEEYSESDETGKIRNIATADVLFFFLDNFDELSLRANGSPKARRTVTFDQVATSGGLFAENISYYLPNRRDSGGRAGEEEAKSEVRSSEIYRRGREILAAPSREFEFDKQCRSVSMKGTVTDLETVKIGSSYISKGEVYPQKDFHFRVADFNGDIVTPPQRLRTGLRVLFQLKNSFKNGKKVVEAFNIVPDTQETRRMMDACDSDVLIMSGKVHVVEAKHGYGFLEKMPFPFEEENPQFELEDDVTFTLLREGDYISASRLNPAKAKRQDHQTKTPHRRSRNNAQNKGALRGASTRQQHESGSRQRSPNVDSKSSSEGSKNSEGHSSESRRNTPPVQQAPPDFLCPICVETLPLDDIHIISTCRHEFCRDCVLQHIRSKVCDSETEPTYPIPCLYPTSQCGNILSIDQDVAIVCPQDIVSKCHKLAMTSYVISDPNTYPCEEPDCGGWVEMFPGAVDFFCPSCGSIRCLGCNVREHHFGKTCDEFRDETQLLIRHNEEEHASEAYIANQRKCPNCNIPIEKNLGCNHMQCTICRSHFCWTCNVMIEYPQHYQGNQCRLLDAPN